MYYFIFFFIYIAIDLFTQWSFYSFLHLSLPKLSRKLGRVLLMTFELFRNISIGNIFTFVVVLECALSKEFDPR